MSETIILPDFKSDAYKNAVKKELLNELDSDVDPNEEAEGDVIDLGQMEVPPMIMEIRQFVDMSKNAQLTTFIDPATNTVVFIKGMAGFPMMTSKGPRMVQFEIDFPLLEDPYSYADSGPFLMANVKSAFENYDKYANVAAEKKKKEIEDEERIIGANGMPINPNGPVKFP